MDAALKKPPVQNQVEIGKIDKEKIVSVLGGQHTTDGILGDRRVLREHLEGLVESRV